MRFDINELNLVPYSSLPRSPRMRSTSQFNIEPTMWQMALNGTVLTSNCKGFTCMFTNKANFYVLFELFLVSRQPIERQQDSALQLGSWPLGMLWWRTFVKSREQEMALTWFGELLVAHGEWTEGDGRPVVTTLSGRHGICKSTYYNSARGEVLYTCILL